MAVRKSMLLAGMITALTALPALAEDDMNFTDDLTGPSSPYLGPIDPDYSYTPDGLERISWQPERTADCCDRPMVRTASSEFSSADFVTTVHVTRPIDPSGIMDLIWFGYGEGNATGIYNEPTNAFTFRIHSHATTFHIDAVVNAGSTYFVAASWSIASFDRDMTFRIAKTEGTVELSIPEVSASASFPAALLDGILDETNSHIFFGNSVSGTIFSDFTVETIGGNTPPDVTAAGPSSDSLWPPNNKMVDISVEGVTDPDGDDVTIEITGITNDETGEEDAGGIGTDTAQVRAARNGNGDGRTYTITFTATDSNGDSSEGSVQVSVAHDQGKKSRGSGKAATTTTSWGEVKRSVQ